MDKINECPKRPSGINGVKQDAFALCHEPYRLAFQIPHDAIARAEIIRFQNDIGRVVTCFHAQELGSLAGEAGNKSVEGHFASFPLVDSDANDPRRAFNDRCADKQAGVCSSGRRRKNDGVGARSCDWKLPIEFDHGRSKARGAHRVRTAIGNHKGSESARTELSFDMRKPFTLAQISAPMNPGPQKIVQEQIAIGRDRRSATQRQVTREPKRSRSGSGLTAVVGLCRTRRNHGIAALRERLRQ